MPYKFPELKKYTINYDLLFSQLSKIAENKLFSDENLTTNYISIFIDKMKEAELEFQNSIKKPNEKKRLTNYYFETQIFHIPIFLTLKQSLSIFELQKF
ncbi:hypothetical protein M9726_002794 [Enterococcus faecalis]|nr:hypothetical protein [Enterococcus faecalis]